MVTSTLLKRTSTSNTPPKSSSSATTSSTSPPTAQRPTKSRPPLKRSHQQSQNDDHSTNYYCNTSHAPPPSSSSPSLPVTSSTTITTPLFNSNTAGAQSSWIHSSPFSSSTSSSPSTSTSSPSSLFSSLSIPTRHVQSTTTTSTTSTSTPSLNNKKNNNSKNHVRRKIDQKHLKKNKKDQNKVVVANTTTTVPNTTNSNHHRLNNNNNSSNKKKRKSSVMVNQYYDEESEEEEDAEDTDDESDESDDDDDSDDEDYVVENNDSQQRTTTTDENDGASATLAKRKRKRKNHTAPVHADTTATPLTTNTLNITPPPMIFCNKTFTTNTKSSVAASSATNQKQQCVFIMYDPVEYKENIYERQELILNDHQLYQRLNEKQVQKIQQGQQQQQQLFSSSSTTSSKNTKQQQEKHVATTSMIPLWALEISTSNINNVNDNNINHINNNNSGSNGSNGSGGDCQEIKSRSDLRGVIFDYVSKNRMKILDMYHVPTYMISHILFPMVHSSNLIDFHMTTSSSSSSSNTGTSNTSASGGGSSSVSNPPPKQKLTANQSILLKILKENMELLFIHVPIASLLPQLLGTNHNNTTTTDYHNHNSHNEHDKMKMINLFEYACQYGTPVFFTSLFTMIEKYCRQQIKQEKGTTTTHEKKKRKKNDYGKKLNSNTDSTVDDEHSHNEHDENEEHLWLTYFKSKWDQAFKRDSESLMNCSMTQSYMHDLMSVVSVEFKQRDEWLKQVLSRSILTVHHVNPIVSSKSPSKSPSLSSSKSPSKVTTTELVFRKDLVQLDQHVISLIQSKDISVNLLDDYVKLGFNVNSMSQSDSIYLRDWAVNWAAESGSLEIVKRLVTHGAVITHDSSSISSLLANENLWNHQQMPITRTLKKHISSQKQQEQESHVKAHSTFLHAAVLGNNLDIVKYAVKECGFNVCDTTDADGDTALAYCCHNNKSREIAKYLMKKGASVNSVNNQGMTPMHLAAQEAHLNQVKFLVLHGASIDERAKNGKTPYHLAVEAKKPDIELIRFLITSGVNVYTRDNHNSPPEKDAKESVKQMIRNTHDQVNSIIAMTAKKCEVQQEILQSENDTLRKELNDIKERLKKLECMVSQLQESSTSSASMKTDDDEEEEEDGVIDLNL